MSRVTLLEQDLPAPSAIARLLEELSWGGKAGADRLRGGGRHLENVLTTEVLQALDFLPRTAFLARVLRAAHGAERTREEHAVAAEEARITVLPGPTACGTRNSAERSSIEIQPDAIITSPRTYALVEAKRNGAGTFGAHQLARELAHTLLVAPPRSPLLLLVLHSAPPIRVHAHGLLGLTDAVSASIDGVLSVLQAEGHALTRDEVLDRAPTSMAWITWSTLQNALIESVDALGAGDASLTASVHRIAAGAIRAIDWHRC
jgi:hypothetical protein